MRDELLVDLGLQGGGAQGRLRLKRASQRSSSDLARMLKSV